MSRHNSKYHRRIRSRHHVVNKTNGGTSTPENIIKLTIEHHRQWHCLFHNLSFLEVAELLIRADSMLKRRSYEDNRLYLSEH